MELLQFSPAQLALLGAIIVGITELISRLRAKDKWVAATITCSALVGGLLALYYKVDFVSGLAAGFGASGFVKTISAFGNKSTAAPSDLVVK